MEIDQRTKRIWKGLADYTNTDDLASRPNALRSLAATLFECIPWMALSEGYDVPEMVLSLTNKGKDFWTSKLTLETQFREQATEYQPRVKQLLTWLSDQTHYREDRAAPWRFLCDHTAHIEFYPSGMDPDRVPPEEAHRYLTHTGRPKVDFPYRALAYKDIADPICDFIHKQYELGREVPIRVCKRSGCGNLVAQFKKRQYCRTETCDRERQKREHDVDSRKNRDRVFIFRLLRLTPAMRKKKVQENVDRLREMASYWKEATHNSPAIVRHALDALKLAIRSSDDAASR
jgi:hypothetical protein